MTSFILYVNVDGNFFKTYRRWFFRTIYSNAALRPSAFSGKRNCEPCRAGQWLGTGGDGTQASGEDKPTNPALLLIRSGGSPQRRVSMTQKAQARSSDENLHLPQRME